ncbi:MAG: putative DNA binding domain-containing protein [Deltaproteobacteria bacterium]|nr:putative DNA binding domain-containing protein [Deltaproteobacteria bacterium]
MYRESETMEKKSSFAAWKEIIISLCAFANKKGGKVVVGLDDQGNPVGLKIGKDTLEEVANKIKMHTDPILYPSINVKTFGPGEIVELEIPESDNKPVFAFEKAYVRVGKANQKLSATEIRDQVKRYTLPDFDQRTLDKDLKGIDLDYTAIHNLNETSFHFGKIPERRILEKLVVLKKGKLTNAGYLCFTKENDLIPNAVIKGARFKGNTMVHFLDMKDFKGNMIAAVNEVFDFIQRHISMSIDIGAKAARDEKWDYPMASLREAVVNAIVHRDYTDPGNIQIRIFDDRLEIWSPGLLPKELNIKTLLSENRSIPRNRGLAKIFHDIGFIEGWGTGFQRMAEGCAVNGNPKPEFKEMTGAFVVKFIRRPASEGISGGINEGTSEVINGGINEGINRTLEFIRKNPGKRVIEIAAATNIPSKTIERWIKKLKEQGKITFNGARKTGGYFAAEEE